MADLSIEEHVRLRTRPEEGDRPLRVVFPPEYDDTDRVGIVGEMAVGILLGKTPNTWDAPKGDPGWDYIARFKWDTFDGLLKLEVRTYRKPIHLFVKENRPLNADVYVLCKYYDPPNERADVLGWCYKEHVLTFTPKLYPQRFGVVNYCVPANTLHDATSLFDHHVPMPNEIAF